MRRRVELEIMSPVVDAGVEAELVYHVGALLRSARNTDGPAAFDLSNLANISADSAGGRGDH